MDVLAMQSQQIFLLVAFHFHFWVNIKQALNASEINQNAFLFQKWEEK